MKKTKKAKATAGMRIADTTTTALSRRKEPTRVMEWNAEMTRLSRRIDRVIARTKRETREEVLQQFTAHCRNMRAALHGNKDIHAVKHWRQCIESFEREMKP